MLAKTLGRTAIKVYVFFIVISNLDGLDIWAQYVVSECGIDVFLSYFFAPHLLTLLLRLRPWSHIMS